MFSLAYKLLKMDAYSNDFKKIFPAKNPWSDQIRLQLVQMLWTLFIFNKSKRYQISEIKDNGQRYQLVRCYNISKTSFSFRYRLKRLCNVWRWSVSLRYQLVCFIYVQARRCKNVSNRSVLLTYQLRRLFRHLRWFSFIKLPVSTSLQRLKDVGLI